MVAFFYILTFDIFPWASQTRRFIHNLATVVWRTFVLHNLFSCIALKTRFIYGLVMFIAATMAWNGCPLSLQCTAFLWLSSSLSVFASREIPLNCILIIWNIPNFWSFAKSIWSEDKDIWLLDIIHHYKHQGNVKDKKCLINIYKKINEKW